MDKISNNLLNSLLYQLIIIHYLITMIKQELIIPIY